jgi:hypothetical protein
MVLVYHVLACCFLALGTHFENSWLDDFDMRDARPVD